MKKRIMFHILFFGMLLCGYFSFSEPIKSKANIYGKWQDTDGDGHQEIRCTWFAWESAYNNMGIQLPNFGNAKDWLTAANNAGYSTGTNAQANSIAVWDGGTYGHVSYVKTVSGATMVVDEGGRTDLDHTSSQGVAYSQSAPSTVGSDRWGQKLIGFIYLESLPQGCVDEIACVGNGKIRVRGWAFDRDNPGISLEIHIYIGGSDEGHAITANKSRTDVNTAYPGVGNNHGFEEVINTKKSGNQTVDIFAINIRKDGSQLGYANPVIGQKTIHISADTTKPTISSIQVSGITRGYYTVTATASDDTGVTDVKFATWSSKNGQDDLKWTTGRKINASTWEGLIQVSDHNSVVSESK